MREPWQDRLAFLGDVAFPMGVLHTCSAWNEGMGPLSRRADYGLRPGDLRPDGETLARDFLAGFASKWSTTITGIVVGYYNHDRCAPGAWEGPDPDGTSRCTSLLPPLAGWQEDADSFDMGDGTGRLLQLPMATLGSSGLPDPGVPGGIVLHVAGTPALANPDFDGCAYPHTFLPDRVALPDSPGGHPAATDAHTWNFGRTDHDLRLVFHTNTRRDFCPADGDGR